MNKSYIAIDLKSFYASVECVQRGLDPLNANLVVADESRTDKTICLAVSPSLKKYGIPGRARLFEVKQAVREINAVRRTRAPKHTFTGKSIFADELEKNPSLELDLAIAKPQMAKYMQISNRIFSIYLEHIAPMDIHVYSIDEVFIDVTGYLGTYHTTPRELAMRLIKQVLAETGITATCGIGTNLYLCKIAMDIVAKKMPADKDGVRIAELDELSYRKELWNHRPLTDFWRVGKGISKKLEAHGMYTMGDVARCSLTNQNLLYKLFGINAELLIDHAWGIEPCTIEVIKSYKPSSNSLSQGQVLPKAYSFEKGKLIVKEMADQLVFDLTKKHLLTDQMVLTVGYDKSALMEYEGKLKNDHYGRLLPESAHGSINLGCKTSSASLILEAITDLYDRIVEPDLPVRRMYVVANHISNEISEENYCIQTDLYENFEEEQKKKSDDFKEKNLQDALVSIKSRYGKNSIVKGMNMLEDAKAMERNGMVGGHKA